MYLSYDAPRSIRGWKTTMLVARISFDPIGQYIQNSGKVVVSFNTVDAVGENDGTPKFSSWGANANENGMRNLVLSFYINKDAISNGQVETAFKESFYSYHNDIQLDAGTTSLNDAQQAIKAANSLKRKLEKRFAKDGNPQSFIDLVTATLATLKVDAIYAENYSESINRKQFTEYKLNDVRQLLIDTASLLAEKKYWYLAA